MKTCKNLAILTVALTSAWGHAQGTFIYDQQSSDESNLQEGGADIQQNQFIGQSFTPQLSSVEFIRIFIYNGILGDTSPATITINLRSNSIAGPVLGTTASVTIPGGSLFAGPVNFVFASPVPVTAGGVYYFQPVVQNNINLGLNQAPSYNYSGGMAFFQGTAFPTRDLWFREGIVPEPSSALLVIIGGGVFIYVRRAHIKKHFQL